MEGALVESLFLPWWKGLLYILALTFSIVVVRVTINFDFNEWSKSREEARILAQIGKEAEQCSHMWTLYPNSSYSQCVGCQAWIPTSILVAAKGFDEPPIILAEYVGAVITHKSKMVIVRDYIGVKE